MITLTLTEHEASFIVNALYFQEQELMKHKHTFPQAVEMSVLMVRLTKLLEQNRKCT